MQRSSTAAKPHVFLRSRSMRGALFGKNLTFFSENVSGIHLDPVQAARPRLYGINSHGQLDVSRKLRAH